MKKNLMILSLSLIAALSTSTSFAALTVYHCNAMDAGTDDVTLTVGNAQFVKVDQDIARLDDSYEPRLNDGYSRFAFEEGGEGADEVLVQDRLIKGSRTGFIKRQFRDDAFGTSKYACTRQD